LVSLTFESPDSDPRPNFPPDFPMLTTSNGDFLKNPDGTQVVISFNQNVGTPSAWWTRKDHTIIASVPEPITILGAATAISFGTAFKRRLAKVTKENKNS